MASRIIIVCNYRAVVKRFVGIDLEGINVGDFQEVLYDDLTNQEKTIFDNFYNSFSS